MRIDILPSLKGAALRLIQRKDGGLIGISNNFTFRDTISARSENSLRETEPNFPSYEANEFRAIREKRAAKAFKDDL